MVETKRKKWGDVRGRRVAEVVRGGMRGSGGPRGARAVAVFGGGGRNSIERLHVCAQQRTVRSSEGRKVMTGGPWR